MDNLPASITSGGVTEAYPDDADGEHLTRTANGTTTVDVAGWYAEDLPTGITRTLYTCNGQVIAQRNTDATGLIYLHADHRGRVSLARSEPGGGKSAGVRCEDGIPEVLMTNDASA